MAEKEIKVKFPEEKLKALQFFMNQKEKKIEEELKDYLDKTYEKVVPNPVRDFVENSMRVAAPELDGERTQVVLCQEKVQVKSGKFIYSSAHLLV